MHVLFFLFFFIMNVFVYRFCRTKITVLFLSFHFTFNNLISSFMIRYEKLFLYGRAWITCTMIGTISQGIFDSRLEPYCSENGRRECSWCFISFYCIPLDTPTLLRPLVLVGNLEVSKSIYTLLKTTNVQYLIDQIHAQFLYLLLS